MNTPTAQHHKSVGSHPNGRPAARNRAARAGSGALRRIRLFGAKPGGDPGKSDQRSSLLFSAVLVGVIGWVMIVYATKLGEPRLVLEANARPDGDSAWVVSGRVFHDGQALRNVTVWASAIDGRGSSYAPPPARTDSLGGFRLAAIPRVIGASDSAAAISISVKALAGKPVLPRTKWRAKSISLQQENTYSSYSIPWQNSFVVALIFGISLLLALTQIDSPLLRHTQYVALVGLAILLFGLVITSLTSVLGELEWTVKQTGADVISLGFAHAVKGTYVKELAPEWILSLTPVTDLRPEQRSPLTGLGAPFWVLLVSVAGAGLFTVSIVIRAVKDPPDTAAPRQFRNRVQEIVLHQFYIIFAPLGCIFVYQLLLVAGAASKPVVVALAALASGVTLNLLLRKAVDAVEVAFAGGRTGGGDGAGHAQKPAAQPQHGGA